MRPRAILKHHSNSYPFEERNIDLTGMVKVGRSVAKFKPQGDNAIFDCKVLSRNHAVFWFENGKVSSRKQLVTSPFGAHQKIRAPTSLFYPPRQFFIKDTCSSNGTFINNNRLSPANEDSPGKEIHSNDIIQFGVEVVDSTSKITHGCIILRIKLFYPNGSEASRTATMFNIPTANMLPPYYSYTQMLEREQQIYQKLNSIEEILDEAHLLVDMRLHVKHEGERLVRQIEELKSECDLKTDYACKLESELEDLKYKSTQQDLRKESDYQMIKSLETRYKEKELEVIHLQKQLRRMIKQDHRLMTIILLLLSIVLVVGGFDMVVMFFRLF